MSGAKTQCVGCGKLIASLCVICGRCQGCHETMNAAWKRMIDTVHEPMIPRREP